MLRWLQRRRQTTIQIPEHPVSYPDGVAVICNGDIFYIKNGKRIKFYSTRCFNSWTLPLSIGTDESLIHYPISNKPLGFRNGTVVLDFSDGKRYYIENSKRRLITTPDFYRDIHIDNTVEAAHEEILLHEEGEPI